MEIEKTETIEQPKSLSLLASEEFGSDFHGEVEEPIKSEPEGAGEEGAEEGASEVSGEEESGEESGEEEGREGEESGEEVPISSMRELVEQQEWDPEWVNTLRVAVKVDGEESEATLSDLVKSYQITTTAEKRLEDAKARTKTANEEIAQKNETLKSQYAAVGELLNRSLALLESDSKEIDWKALREDDPAEYAAKRSEFQDRRQQIDQLVHTAATSYQQTTVEQQQKIQEQQVEFLEQERGKLIQALPDWADPEKAKEGKAKIAVYMKAQGFTDQELANLFDHRALLLARKAMLYDEGQVKNQVAKKKLAKVPKTLKPGATKAVAQVNQEKVDKARKRLQQSGSIDDAVALLQSRRA